MIDVPAVGDRAGFLPHQFDPARQPCLLRRSTTSQPTPVNRAPCSPTDRGVLVVSTGGAEPVPVDGAPAALVSDGTRTCSSWFPQPRGRGPAQEG